MANLPINVFPKKEEGGGLLGSIIGGLAGTILGAVTGGMAAPAGASLGTVAGAALGGASTGAGIGSTGGGMLGQAVKPGDVKAPKPLSSLDASRDDPTVQMAFLQQARDQVPTVGLPAQDTDEIMNYLNTALQKKRGFNGP